jgi:hypothetical protein
MTPSMPKGTAASLSTAAPNVAAWGPGPVRRPCEQPQWRHQQHNQQPQQQEPDGDARSTGPLRSGQWQQQWRRHQQDRRLQQRPPSRAAGSLGSAPPVSIQHARPLRPAMSAAAAAAAATAVSDSCTSPLLDSCSSRRQGLSHDELPLTKLAAGPSNRHLRLGGMSAQRSRELEALWHQHVRALHSSGRATPRSSAGVPTGPGQKQHRQQQQQQEEEGNSPPQSPRLQQDSAQRVLGVHQRHREQQQQQQQQQKPGGLQDLQSSACSCDQQGCAVCRAGQSLCQGASRGSSPDAACMPQLQPAGGQGHEAAIAQTLISSPPQSLESGGLPGVQRSLQKEAASAEKPLGCTAASNPSCGGTPESAYATGSWPTLPNGMLVDGPSLLAMSTWEGHLPGSSSSSGRGLTSKADGPDVSKERRQGVAGGADASGEPRWPSSLGDTLCQMGTMPKLEASSKVR